MTHLGRAQGGKQESARDADQLERCTSPACRHASSNAALRIDNSIIVMGQRRCRDQELSTGRLSSTFTGTTAMTAPIGGIERTASVGIQVFVLCEPPVAWSILQQLWSMSVRTNQPVASTCQLFPYQLGQAPDRRHHTSRSVSTQSSLISASAMLAPSSQLSSL